MSKSYQKPKKQTDHQMEKSFNSKIILPLISGDCHRTTQSFRGHTTEIVLSLHICLVTKTEVFKKSLHGKIWFTNNREEVLF